MSKDGEHVINGFRIDPSLLKCSKIERCDLRECQAACCVGGVWLNPDEKPKILEAAEIIQEVLPPERRDISTWFEVGKPDTNYPEGHEMGTNTVDDPVKPGETCCVFLLPDRECALQVASMKHGLGWPGLKPFYCALYPLYLEEDVLSLDEDTPLELIGGGCQRPATRSQPIFQIYPEEAILVLGEDGYRELCEKQKIERRRAAK